MSNETWFKVRTTPAKIRHLKKLAEGRGRNMSEYFWWLVAQDEQKQAEELPEQPGLFGTGNSQR